MYAGVEMQNRPTHGIKSKNRIQYETTPDGKNVFRAYRIHEWDGWGYYALEDINDFDQAINRALELGYEDDAKKLEEFR